LWQNTESRDDLYERTWVRPCANNRRAKVARSLWTCPQCRRQFKNRNQSHSCGQFTVEALLDGRPAGVIELYDRLAEVIGQCGEVVVAPTKTTVLFKVRTVFASVAIAKNWLDVVLVLGRRAKHRRFKKAQAEYPGIVHWLRIERIDEIDEDLVGWLREAYEHCKRKHDTQDGPET
jgi:hypothetical protein